MAVAEMIRSGGISDLGVYLLNCSGAEFRGIMICGRPH